MNKSEPSNDKNVTSIISNSYTNSGNTDQLSKEIIILPPNTINYTFTAPIKLQLNNNFSTLDDDDNSITITENGYYTFNYVFTLLIKVGSINNKFSGSIIVNSYLTIDTRPLEKSRKHATIFVLNPNSEVYREISYNISIDDEPISVVKNSSVRLVTSISDLTGSFSDYYFTELNYTSNAYNGDEFVKNNNTLINISKHT